MTQLSMNFIESEFFPFQTPSTIVFLLALVGCAVALPLRPERSSDPLTDAPILEEQEHTEITSQPQEQSTPLAYTLLFGKLNSAEEASSSDPMEKRSAKVAEEDDLETAAGTYALRPLFVYRQQLAYRQRVRDAIRRRNQF